MNESRYRAYVYPNTSRDGGMINPYISHFMDSLIGKIEVVNRNSPSHSGIFDILKYMRKIDILFLNWPEEIPVKKGGFLQMFFFILLIYYLKYKNVRIFWTLHNKESHIQQKAWIKNYVRNITAKKSDYIITHAREGISLIEKLSKPGRARIKFFHHPVLPPIPLADPIQKKYDILIWGMVAPYKGIDRFLKFIRNEQLQQLKILIAGKITDDSYRNEILSYQTDHIEILDAFITLEQLEKFIAQSRVVLFTYLENSILSSGALMDTLRYAPLIVGPNYGAFKDLYQEGLIYVYDNYAQLKTILADQDLQPDSWKIHKFITDHSWSDFGTSVYNLVHSDKIPNNSL